MLFTHCQKRDFGAKNRSVLSIILIGFSENPLELGEIGGDFRTRIFTAFSMRTGAKSLENTAFSGFSHLPLSKSTVHTAQQYRTVCMVGNINSLKR